MILSVNERQILTRVAHASGGRFLDAYYPPNGTGDPCVAIVLLGLRSLWNAAELLAELDTGLARALRSPASERDGAYLVLYWPGVRSHQ